jgi:hypothetical protein
LIVEEGPWEQNPAKTPPNKIIYVRVNYDETYLRRLVGAAGGRWNRIRKLWELPYRAVVELGLEDRVVDQIKKVSNIGNLETPQKVSIIRKPFVSSSRHF